MSKNLSEPEGLDVSKDLNAQDLDAAKDLGISKDLNESEDFGMSDDLSAFFEDDEPLSAVPTAKKSLVLFFLVDVSGSMSGTKIGTLNTVMEEVIPAIRGEGGADVDIKIAVLKFSNGCEWMDDEPVSIETFQWDRRSIEAQGLTDMGAAFEELADKMSRKKFLRSPSLSYAPVIFLLTDGYPTDDYQAGINRLKTNKWYKYGLKVALGIGEDAENTKDILKEFTTTEETVVYAFNGEQLAHLIRKIAVDSVKIGSKSMSLSNEDNRELEEADVSGRKQQEFSKQIQETINSDDFPDDVSFDEGW